jgi:hypothetical protein
MWSEYDSDLRVSEPTIVDSTAVELFSYNVVHGTRISSYFRISMVTRLALAPLWPEAQQSMVRESQQYPSASQAHIDDSEIRGT